MKKKLFGLLICLTILLSITGCRSKEDILKGNWTAKPENQIVYKVDENETVGGNIDYILECDGSGNYTLSLENGVEKGTYTIDKDTNITFKDENNLILGICNINNDEIICNENDSFYALKYTKN